MAGRGLRVALAAESFDARTGGAARAALALESALAARGHSVRRASPRPGRRIPRERSLLRAAEAARAQADVSCSLARAPADVWAPQGGAHLAALAASLRARSPERGALAALARLLTPRQWLFLGLERRAAREARAIVALSQRTRKDLIALAGAEPRRIALVPNGAPVARLAPPSPEGRRAARVALGLVDGERAILFVAHDARLKGLRPLVRALALAPSEARAREILLIAGRAGRPSVERAAARAGVRARGLGYVGDMASAYHAADIFCLPSHHDPCSLAALEALAAGLPVVTSRVNGASELLTGAEGALLADPSSAEEIAAALEGLRDADRRRAAALAARASALRHPEARALERLVTLIEDVAGSRPGASA